MTMNYPETASKLGHSDDVFSVPLAEVYHLCIINLAQGLVGFMVPPSLHVLSIRESLDMIYLSTRTVAAAKAFVHGR